MNKYLTAANEKAVLDLVQDTKAKTIWQTRKHFQGTRAADEILVTHYKLPAATVKAARFYW